MLAPYGALFSYFLNITHIYIIHILSSLHLVSLLIFGVTSILPLYHVLALTI